MDIKIKEAQKRILSLCAKEAKGFALAGGTALEIYYLHHRFSWDLDFFSPLYNLSEIEHLVSVFEKATHKKVTLESELRMSGKAKVRFYSMPVKGASRPLKIYFVEDVFFPKPTIQKNEGVRVYSVENIYLQKIMAMSGTRPQTDEVGRPLHQGRNEARDAFDVYMLSKRIQPLHKFLHKVSTDAQKGIVLWYRTFSRQDLKLTLLDLEIYDQQFNSRELIHHMENEIKLFTKEMLDQ